MSLIEIILGLSIGFIIGFCIAIAIVRYKYGAILGYVDAQRSSRNDPKGERAQEVTMEETDSN